MKELGVYNDMSSEQMYVGLIHWSTLIRKRDDYTCQYCGSTYHVCAHHMMPKKYFPKMALDENNGITLCHACHMLVHKKLRECDD